MNTVTVTTRSQGQFGPYHVAVPIAMVILAFYAKQFLPFGALGLAAGALVGLLWVVGLGFIAQRLARQEERRVWLANGAVFLSIIVIGLIIGGGLMYVFMMNAALDEPSLTYSVLSSLMKPAVPYYIILNTLMELFLVSLIVFWNWNSSPHRRTLILIGVLSYFAMRIWTYLVFAETRLDITQHTLSQADVDWFKRTLAADFRVVLNNITYVCFLLAAFLPVRSHRYSKERMALHPNAAKTTSVLIGGGGAKPAALASRETTRWLALGAIAGPVLFTLAWFLLGFLSPGYSVFGTLIAPYSPISQPISGLGIGPTGPFMNTAFVLSGPVLGAGVIGVFETLRASGRPIARWACAALLMLSPLGLVMAGIFNLESPLPHLIGFLLATGTPVVSFLAAGLFFRGIPRWKRFGNWLLLGSPLTLLLVVLFFLTFDQATTAAGLGVAGLTSRFLGIEVHAWFVAMGWLAFRRW